MLLKRIQRKRTKGWRMPINTKYVGRPTKWGNPYATAQEYRDKVVPTLDRGLLRQEFEGIQFIACWCQLGDECHADAIIEVVNG